MENGEQEIKAAAGQTSRFKKLGFKAIVLAIVFLLGYVPSYWKARSLEKEQALLEQQFSLARLHSQLGMASFEANRNNYHNAAEYSNRFFSGLRAVIDNAGDAALAEKLQAVSAGRDSITTYLAKADPAVKDKIAQMYADFYQIAAAPQ
jgi:hypothetical protein